MSIEHELQKSWFRMTKGDGSRHEAACQDMGVSSSFMYRILNENDPAAALRITQFLAFLRITKDLGPLRYLCRAVGCALVPLPRRVARANPKTILQLQGVMLDCVKALMGHQAGHATAAEAKGKIRGLIEELIRAERMIDAGRELELEAAQGEINFSS
jgi:hypothetical protein